MIKEKKEKSKCSPASGDKSGSHEKYLLRGWRRVSLRRLIVWTVAQTASCKHPDSRVFGHLTNRHILIDVAIFRAVRMTLVTVQALRGRFYFRGLAGSCRPTIWFTGLLGISLNNHRALPPLTALSRSMMGLTMVAMRGNRVSGRNGSSRGFCGFHMPLDDQRTNILG